MSEEGFEAFLREAFTLAADHSRDGAVWFACMDWRHIAEIRAAGRRKLILLRGAV